VYDINTLQFIEVNDAAIASYGYSKSEFLSMSIVQIRPKEDHQKLKHSVQNLPDNFYKSGHWKHIKKSGEIITVSLSSHQLKFDGRDAEMVMSLDVTDQLKYEEGLKSMYLVEKSLKEELEQHVSLLAQSYREKARLADIIQKVSNIIVITDLNGIITWVNSSFSKHTGYLFQEVIGRDLSFLHGPETNALMQMEILKSLEKGEPKTFEILNYAKDGTKYWTDLNISNIFNEDGKLTEYISIQSIITDRKEREHQIKDQNAMLKNMAWMNSHSLRKPVASIISLAGLGLEETSLKEIHEYQKLIKICSEDLDRIIRDIDKQIRFVEIDI
jgi:PAS domain S-box-containing protein